MRRVKLLLMGLQFSLFLYAYGKNIVNLSTKIKVESICSGNLN